MTLREQARGFALATAAAAATLVGAGGAFYRWDSTGLAAVIVLGVGGLAAGRIGVWGAFAAAWAAVVTALSAGFVAEIGRVEVRGGALRLAGPAALERARILSEWEGLHEVRRIPRKPAAAPIVGDPTVWAVCRDLLDDPRDCAGLWGEALAEVVTAREEERASYVGLPFARQGVDPAAAEGFTFVYWTPPERYTAALWADAAAIVGAAGIGWLALGALALGATALARRPLARAGDDALE